MEHSPAAAASASAAGDSSEPRVRAADAMPAVGAVLHQVRHPRRPPAHGLRHVLGQHAALHLGLRPVPRAAAVGRRTGARQAGALLLRAARHRQRRRLRLRGHGALRRRQRRRLHCGFTNKHT